MCDMVTRVSQWLQSVFGEQKVPEFEVTKCTIDVLDHLVTISEERCGDVQLLIDDHRQKAAEYRIDSDYLKELLLQSVDMKPESFYTPTSNFLSVLEGTAQALKVKDTAVTSFITAMNEQTRNLAKAENTHSRLTRELLAKRKTFAATLLQKKELCQDMKRIVEDQQLEAAAAEQKLLNKEFILDKIKDLKCSKTITNDEQASRDMERGLEHQVIVQLADQVKEVEQAIKLLEKKLEAYSDLCPSPDLVLVKIEEAKAERDALDLKLDKMVDINSL